MDGYRMLPEGLWCALADLYSARQAGSGLPELACTVPMHIPVSRDAQASWATIITARDGDSYLSIPRYLGMALVTREA